MIIYPIRSDIPPSFVRAIERQKVTSRARGQWHLSKNRSPFFHSRQERAPCAHLLFEPRSRGRARRAYAYAYNVRARTRSTRTMSLDCMWAKLNEIWPDVYFERSAGRCRVSSKTYPVHMRFARTHVCNNMRACVHVHTWY